MPNLEPDHQLARKLNVYAWIATVVVLAVVGSMRHIHFESDIDFSFLPPLYSTLNAITGLILMMALYFIRTKQVNRHRQSMTLAAVLSLLFLAGYVIYHTTTPETRYGGEGGIRYVYFFLLITHIILAAIIFPFVLFTYIRAFTRQFDKHKKLARWVYWVWLYVALTGPVLYFMIKPWYNQ